MKAKKNRIEIKAEHLCMVNTIKIYVRTYDVGQAYNVRCAICQEPFTKKNTDMLLRADKSPNLSILWQRGAAHDECIAFHLLLKNPCKQVEYTKDKSARSGGVFLLLGFLGLPSDLAWPIVAMAYWLL
jgi:hypothetical protein